jgi:PAS domain S-box-containing protein
VDNRKRGLLLAAIIGLGGLVFIFDLLTPLGLVVWVLYLPVILASALLEHPRYVMLTAAGCSVLTVVGFFLSPPGIPLAWGLINRGLGLAAIGLTALVGLAVGRRSVQLEHQVTERTTHLEQANALLRQEIEERHRAEQALRDREVRHRAILDTAVDAIITIDQRGIIESVNPAAERMFGYSAGEMVGRNVNMLMPSPHREQHEGYRARFLQTGVKRIIGIGREVQGLRKDGSLVPVDLAVSEINHLRIFAGILRDLTPRKELEKEVLEVATLEQQRIGQELHDGVGQELTALGLLAGGLVEALGEGPPAEARLVAKIAEGLKKVLGQVRALSRGLFPVEVDTAGLMAALAELAARTSELQGVTCTFGCKEPVLVADNQKATHLYRIAKEAVTNVLRHAQARHIAISLEDDGQSVVLRIQDDGVGFSPEPEATKGMGLKIMHYRAGLINARLAVGPAEPVGTLVTCTLSKGTDHGQEQDQGK